MLRRFDYLVKQFDQDEDRTLENYLMEYGSQGWRLHTLLPVGRSTYEIVFERPIEDN